MSTCTDSIPLENIDFCPTEEIAAGVSETEIYAAFLADIDTVEAPPALAAATTLDAAATIAGDHVFTAPKGFFKLNVLPDTGIVETAMVGEKGSKSFSNSFGGTLPGTTPRNLGFGRKAKNAPMIFIVVETTGRKRQIGSKVKPAYFEEFAPSSGAKAEDVNGVPFKISDVQAYPAPVYAGTITEFTPA